MAGGRRNAWLWLGLQCEPVTDDGSMSCSCRSGGSHEQAENKITNGAGDATDSWRINGVTGDHKPGLQAGIVIDGDISLLRGELPVARTNGSGASGSLK